MKQAMPIRWLEAAEARAVCQLAAEALPARSSSESRPATMIRCLPALLGRLSRRSIAALPSGRAA